jgi:LTXXQ motif family protein
MTPRKSLLALLTAAALAATATAALGHTPTASGRGPGAQPELAAQRLAEMKAALRITPDQQAVWNNYEQAVSRAAAGRGKLHESMSEARGRTDAMDDLRVGMMKFNAQAAEDINAARKALVARLSPEQARAFEATRAGGRGPGFGHGGGYGAGGGFGPGHRHGDDRGPGFGPGGGHGWGGGMGRGAAGGCPQTNT